MFNIRFASIRELDISNGSNVGVSVFIQGCQFEPHCKNCFNPETWSFDGGSEWTEKIENKFIELASRPYIKRISLLGGEPLSKQNLDDVLMLIKKIKHLLPDKQIWLYSGFTWEQIFNNGVYLTRDCDGWKRREIVKHTDVFVDGVYIESKRNVNLKWRGSSNQRVINTKKSLKQGKVILYCD